MGAPGFKAQRRGCLRCVVRSWADERGCPGHGAEGKTDRHQLGLDDKRPGRGSPLSGLIPSVSCLWRKRGPGRRDCPGKRFGGGHGPWPPSPWEPSACPGQPTDGEDVEGALGAGLDGKDRRGRKGPPPGRGDTLEAGRVRPSVAVVARERAPRPLGRSVCRAHQFSGPQEPISDIMNKTGLAQAGGARGHGRARDAAPGVHRGRTGGRRDGHESLGTAGEEGRGAQSCRPGGGSVRGD